MEIDSLERFRFELVSFKKTVAPENTWSSDGPRSAIQIGPNDFLLWQAAHKRDSSSVTACAPSAVAGVVRRAPSWRALRGEAIGAVAESWTQHACVSAPWRAACHGHGVNCLGICNCASASIARAA